MQRLLPILLCSLSLLTACASTTPIAVRTPQWHVPPVPAFQRQQENADLKAAEQSSNAWQCAVMALPGSSDPLPKICAAANATVTP